MLCSGEVSVLLISILLDDYKKITFHKVSSNYYILLQDDSIVTSIIRIDSHFPINTYNNC